MDVIAVGVGWLHLAATVVVLGYYAIVSLFILPILRRSLSLDAVGPLVAAVERRTFPAIIVALVVFLATGIYLTGADDRYTGAGAIESPWAGAILVKHGVIVAMVVVGAWVDAMAMRAGSLAEGADRATPLRRFGRGSLVLTVLGGLVLLLTAVAQA